MITDWPAMMKRTMACEYLSISDQKMRELICAGQIKPVTLPGGKELMFRRYDLDKFIDRLQEVSGAAIIRERQKYTESARKSLAEKRKVEESQVEQGSVEGSLGAVG